MKLTHLPRRECLRTGVATIAVAIASDGWANGDPDASVMTVTGAISASQLGVTLPHEHVLVDFVAAAKVSRERYDQNEAFTARSAMMVCDLQQSRQLSVVDDEFIVERDCQAVTVHHDMERVPFANGRVSLDQQAQDRFGFCCRGYRRLCSASRRFGGCGLRSCYGNSGLSWCGLRIGNHRGIDAI